MYKNLTLGWRQAFQKQDLESLNLILFQNLKSMLQHADQYQCFITADVYLSQSMWIFMQFHSNQRVSLGMGKETYLMKYLLNCTHLMLSSCVPWAIASFPVHLFCKYYQVCNLYTQQRMSNAPIRISVLYSLCIQILIVEISRLIH